MRSFIFITILLALIYVAKSQNYDDEDEDEDAGQAGNTTNTEEKCFKSFNKNEWRGKIKAKIQKKFQPVIDDCKSENPDGDKKTIKKCCKTKIKAAWTDCKSANVSIRDCVRNKLKLEKSESGKLTKDEIKEKIISNLINESKKSEVEEAIAKCDESKGREYWFCALEQLADGPCSELKSFVDKITMFRDRMQQRKANRKNKN